MPYYKSVFISDLHLGSPWCQAGDLIGFLSSVECEKMYLVGDIFDAERPARSRQWPRDQVRILKMLRDLSRHTEVTYVTGNHDAFMRKEHQLRTMFELALPNVNIREAIIHQGDDGRRYLVVHGDSYDPALRVPLLGRIGTWFYVHLRSLSERFPLLFQGLASESLENALMRLQDSLTRLLGDPEAQMMADAAQLECDGVICGHTHLADLRTIGGLIYANCGYWSGPPHAVVERPGGALALLSWNESWLPAPSHNPLSVYLQKS